MSDLEVVDGVQRVDGGHTAVLEAEEEALVVLAGIAQVLPDEHEVGSEGAHHLRTVAENRHADRGAGVGVRHQRQLLELGLLHADVKVALESLPSEILGPAHDNRYISQAVQNPRVCMQLHHS